MKLIMLKGVSKTGKTTTCEAIIRELVKRGYSVGSVKDIHYEAFKMDTEGTNTFRHMAAGSQIVTARGPRETDILYNHQLDIDTILDLYNLDFAVLEGDSGANCPVIITGKEIKDLDERFNERVIAVSGVISETLKEYKGLPVINGLTDIERLVDLIEEKCPDRMPNFEDGYCNMCGSDCKGLLTRILSGKAVASDCILYKGNTELIIGGKGVKMKPFIRAMLRNIVEGTVEELKGFTEDEDIIVKITRRRGENGKK